MRASRQIGTCQGPLWPFCSALPLRFVVGWCWWCVVFVLMWCLCVGVHCVLCVFFWWCSWDATLRFPKTQYEATESHITLPLKPPSSHSKPLKATSRHCEPHKATVAPLRATQSHARATSTSKFAGDRERLTKTCYTPVAAHKSRTFPSRHGRCPVDTACSRGAVWLVVLLRFYWHIP